MVDWDPREHMGRLSYLLFKRGIWVEVDTVPEWVEEASNPPKKTNIPVNGSVESVFTGDSLEYKVITKRLPRAAGTYTESEYRVRIKDKTSPGSSIKLALALVAMVLVAGLLLSMAPSEVNNPSDDETGSAAASNYVNNPWNSEIVSVATSNDASKELEAATEQSVEYWNENGESFSKYEFEFSYTDDAADSDILIEPDDYPLQCDYTISTDTIGCAPILDSDSTVDGQTVVRVIGDIPQPAARAAVKHELGHVLGLEHSDKPQSLMDHDSRLTGRQQSVINSANTGAIETSIERGINEYRERHGQRRLSSDRELREMARSRAEELARSDESGVVVYTDDGMDLTCEIDLGRGLYLPEGDADLYSTSLYTFEGFGGLTNYSTAEYTGSPSDAAQQTVTEWQFNPSEPGHAEHYSRHGVGVYITDDGDFAAVRAIC